MKQYTMEGIRTIETHERTHVFTWLKKIRRWDEYKAIMELARANKEEETHALFVGIHHEDIIAAHYLCHVRITPDKLTDAFCIMMFPFAEDDKSFAYHFLAQLANSIMQKATGTGGDEHKQGA